MNQQTPSTDTTDTTTQTPVNTPFSRAQFEKEVAAFGRDFGAGANSRPAMAIRAVEASHKLTDVGPDDAKDIYTRFQQSAAKKKGIEYAVESSFKVQVSKLRQFLVMGANPNIDGLGVIERTVDKLKELAAQGEDSPLTGSAYDNMVKVARAQNANPDQELNDDEILEVLTPDVQEKGPLDALIDGYKRIRKLHDTEGMPKVALPLIEDAIHNLEQAILDAGGDIPPTKEQVAKAKKEGKEVAEQVALQLARAASDKRRADAKAANVELGSGIGTIEVQALANRMISEGSPEMLPA